MDEREYFLVYRVYGPNEREYEGTNSRVYGWTGSKKVLNAFLKQRDKNKYIAYAMDIDDIIKVYNNSDPNADEMIDILKVKSATTGEEFHLFMTMNEMIESEKKILRLFRELSSISNIKFTSSDKEIEYFLMLIINMKDKYYDAMNYIGYRPPEVTSMYDSVDDDPFTERLIDFGYMEYGCYSSNKVITPSIIDDIATKIIYSLESFIKVLRDDL